MGLFTPVAGCPSPIVHALSILFNNVESGLDAENVQDALDELAALDQSLLINLARDPELIVEGTITRDADGAALTADVVWPGGIPGTFTADEVSTDFPGAVDAYHITYGSPVVRTYTQPAVTRDLATGAVTLRPDMVVS